MANQQSFLEQAITLAVENVQSGKGGPFGAVVVKDGVVIGTGVNLVVKRNDPSAHAEILAIREACKALGTFQLGGCELYASCEPCPMCLAATYWARLDAVYYAGTREDAAAAGFDDEFIYDEFARPAATRKLKLVRIPSPEAAEAFKAWAANPERVEY